MAAAHRAHSVAAPPAQGHHKLPSQQLSAAQHLKQALE